MGGYIITISQVQCQFNSDLRIALHLNFKKSHSSSFNVQSERCCGQTLKILICSETQAAPHVDIHSNLFEHIS